MAASQAMKAKIIRKAKSLGASLVNTFLNSMLCQEVFIHPDKACWGPQVSTNKILSGMGGNNIDINDVV